MYLNLLQLGRIPYAEGLAIQKRVVDARKQGTIADTLLLLEHPPVLTLGRNSRRENVLASDELLASRNVELHEINRGGDVTYHGPGQLVGYPIFDLRGDLPGKRGPHLGPVDFMRMLEEVIIRVCGDFGIPAQRIAGRTGVWTKPYAAESTSSAQEKKICAMGIHVSQGVTSHGFALNVTTDLRDFDLIVPCGITDRTVTSLELEAHATDDPSRQPTIQNAIHSTARAFGRVFARQMIAVESLDDVLQRKAST